MALKLLRCAALERLHMKFGASQVWFWSLQVSSNAALHTAELSTVTLLSVVFIPRTLFSIILRLRCGLTDGLQNCRVFRLLRNIRYTIPQCSVASEH